MDTVIVIGGYWVLILAAWVTVSMIRGLFFRSRRPNSGLVYLAIPLWLIGLVMIGLFN